MSLNISKKILAISKVTVEVRISSLAPRQQANLKRFVRTGIIWGNSEAAILAEYILNSKGLSYIHRWGKGTSTYVYPVRCPIGSKGHEMIKELHARSQLEGGDEYEPGYSRGRNITLEWIENPERGRYVKLYHGIIKDTHKQYSFDHEVEIDDVYVMTFDSNDSSRSL